MFVVSACENIHTKYQLLIISLVFLFTLSHVLSGVLLYKISDKKMRNKGNYVFVVLITIRYSYFMNRIFDLICLVSAN